MGRETQPKEIGGRLFVVHQLPAFAALRLKVRILRVIGAPLVAALVAGDKELSADVIGAVVASLFERLTPEEYESIIRALLDGAQTKNDKGELVDLIGVFDLVMRGRMLDVLKLIRFALEVNYQDFFDGARALGLRAALAKVAGSKGSSGSATSGLAGDSSPGGGPQ